MTFWVLASVIFVVFCEGPKVSPLWYQMSPLAAAGSGITPFTRHAPSSRTR